MSAESQAGAAPRAEECGWLDAPRRALASARAADRMPHALLIQAAAGTGGELLATWAAQLVLCTAGSRSEIPCGACAGCRRVAQRQHPDLIDTGLIEDSQQIRIEQVRELAAELALTSHQGGYKVGIVSPADTMNRFAANALLKTLEEPPARTLLVLVAAQPSRLPATILSRCQRVVVPAPERAQSLAFLERLSGAGDWNPVLEVIGEAPLAAAALDPAAFARLRSDVAQGLEALRAGRADPAATAERWSRSDLALRLAVLENWVTNCIRRGLLPVQSSAEMRSGAQMTTASPVINTRRMFHLLDSVRELRIALSTPINRALALESLLGLLLP